MITTASNHYDEHLKRYKASILAGIEEVRDYCESNEQLDEYTYILLWRPVEWIIEYCALVDYKEYRGDMTESTIEDFIAERKELSVDRKILSISASELYMHYDEINFLRRRRNSVIYHYIKESYGNPFECFDSICKEFVRIYCPEDVYTPISPLNCQIRLSEMTKEYDTDMEHIYERIHSVINYINNSRHNKVIAICRMEELIQIMMYKILKEDYSCTIQYYRNGRKGIFINDERSISYIDYFAKKYNDKLLTKNLCIELELLRSTRNKAMHVFNITDEMEADFRLLWATILNNYFGYEEKISRLLYLFLAKENLQKSIRNLYRDNNYIDHESGHQAIVTIGRHLPQLNRALERTYEIYDKLILELSNNQDSSKEEILSKWSTEISIIFDTAYHNADESTRGRYREMAKSYFRANYSDNSVTYHYLETALMLYNIIGDYPFDKAGVCIELTKALENYLYCKIAVKLRDYMEHDPDIQIDRQSKKSIQIDKPTLGSYTRLYTDHENTNSRAFLRFCIDNKIYSIDDENALKNEILEEMMFIKDINADYRIPIAHRGQISTEMMNNCMGDILTGRKTTDAGRDSIDSDGTTSEICPILRRICVATADY